MLSILIKIMKKRVNKSSKPVQKGRNSTRKDGFKPKSDGKREPYKGKIKKNFRVVRKDGSQVNAIKKDDKLIRLNRFIAHSGICSRREADDLIAVGVIKVNGKIITELGTKIDPILDRIHYEDQLLNGEKLKYLLINKPKGFTSTVDDPRKKKTVLNLMGSACKERLYPVDRLGRSTTGVLLMTNDLTLAKKLNHYVHGAPKVYSVTLDNEVSVPQLRKMREGILIEGTTIKVDKVDYAGKGKRTVGIEIHMGESRLIKQMFTILGLEVMQIDCVLFAGLTKKNLPRGNWRFLDQKEIKYLLMM